MAKMRLPGFFLRNPARRYGLEYHAEQLPDPESRLTLGDGARPARPAPAPHRPALLRRRRGLGASAPTPRSRPGSPATAWRGSTTTRAGGRGAAAVLAERQGRRAPGRHDPHGATAPGQGVVDGHCRVFGTPGLHVVSTAVLPTSGQANPTLTAVQLGLRLADELAGAIGRGPSPRL